jgi:hypothetical protein
MGYDANAASTTALVKGLAGLSLVSTAARIETTRTPTSDRAAPHPIGLAQHDRGDLTEKNCRKSAEVGLSTSNSDAATLRPLPGLYPLRAEKHRKFPSQSSDRHREAGRRAPKNGARASPECVCGGPTLLRVLHRSLRNTPNPSQLKLAVATRHLQNCDGR